MILQFLVLCGAPRQRLQMPPRLLFLLAGFRWALQNNSTTYVIAMATKQLQTQIAIFSASLSRNRPNREWIVTAPLVGELQLDFSKITRMNTSLLSPRTNDRN